MTPFEWLLLCYVGLAFWVGYRAGLREAKKMKLTIELERETDGRWIADVPALGILLYGETMEHAFEAAAKAALEILSESPKEN